MRRLAGALASIGACLAAGAAAAAPAVEIDNAVARVTVIPEARSDIRVDIVKANPRLPFRVWSFFGQTYVDGGLGRRVRGCGGTPAQPTALVAGLGVVPAQAMPQIVIHTPFDVHVAVKGDSAAVWGQVGPSLALDLVNIGCGAWTAANVRGPLRVRQAGAGAVRAGQAGQADLSATGSGSISTGGVAGPVRAMNVGSGDIEVASLNGDFDARIAGAGRVRAAGGRAGFMQASIAGAGDIILDGVAGSLKVSIWGSGGVRVAHVVGAVSKSVIGSGSVRIGP